APPPAPRRRGGFLGGLIGGLLAAGLGYGVAQLVPQGWPFPGTADLTAALDAQQATNAALTDRLAAIEAQIAALPAPVDPAPAIAALREDLAAQIAALPAPGPAADVAGLQSALAALTARVAAVESRPAAAATGGADLAPLQAELAALTARLAAVEAGGAGSTAEVERIADETRQALESAAAEAATLREAAESAARAATARAAISRVQAAMESGGPFTAALDDLAAAGLDIPPELAAVAQAGVPTPAEIERTFPAAARDALNAALRAEPGASLAERALSFVRSQTGARSLEPREGDDPDAILSRAEAALAEGALDRALTELAALPEPAQAALADWRALADIRAQALTAVAGLVAALDAR
ncbi:MAG: hypothetical protein IE927_10845, partial [Rhodobacterales bacterium]|nr:hypothetical protein [Rhodobacterales bacterium]